MHMDLVPPPSLVFNRALPFTYDVDGSPSASGNKPMCTVAVDMPPYMAND